MGRGADYEQVAPAACERCGGAAFERHGYIGLWDGGSGGGQIYAAVCLGCRAVWESRSDPFVCRDSAAVVALVLLQAGRTRHYI